MNAAELLVSALRDPASTAGFGDAEWTTLITAARAESLIGSLACRLTAQVLPDHVRALLEEAKIHTEHGHVLARWEAEIAARTLIPLGIRIVLMKGTAYLAADLPAAKGRSVGDLDIMVAKDRLDETERALLDAGWEWVKPDPYDDEYYRRWMHELPPLIHRERDRMVDVHHTILPLTARPKPDAAAMLADAVRLESGLYVFQPTDMICHAVAHFMADGDLAGGLRNLWDIDRLLRAFADKPDFWRHLAERAKIHGLQVPLERTLRLTQQIYATPVDPIVAGRQGLGDWLYVRRLLARNGWGQEARKLLRLCFYIRSHWLRMPPLMLARHLWIKWRKG